jgi:hypothetical protein
MGLTSQPYERLRLIHIAASAQAAAGYRRTFASIFEAIRKDKGVSCTGVIVVDQVNHL